MPQLRPNQAAALPWNPFQRPKQSCPTDYASLAAAPRSPRLELSLSVSTMRQKIAHEYMHLRAKAKLRQRARQHKGAPRMALDFRSSARESLKRAKGELVTGDGIRTLIAGSTAQPTRIGGVKIHVRLAQLPVTHRNGFKRSLCSRLAARCARQNTRS